MTRITDQWDAYKDLCHIRSLVTSETRRLLASKGFEDMAVIMKDLEGLLVAEEGAKARFTFAANQSHE